MSAPADARRTERDRELAEYVARIADAAPPLTREQSDALALLLCRPRDARGAA